MTVDHGTPSGPVRVRSCAWRWSILDAIAADRLTPADGNVALVIGAHLDDDGAGATIGTRRLSRLAGMSHGRLLERVRGLEVAGYLERVVGSGRRATSYAATVPSDDPRAPNGVHATAEEPSTAGNANGAPEPRSVDDAVHATATYPQGAPRSVDDGVHTTPGPTPPIRSVDDAVHANPEGSPVAWTTSARSVDTVVHEPSTTEDQTPRARARTREADTGHGSTVVGGVATPMEDQPPTPTREPDHPADPEPADDLEVGAEFLDAMLPALPFAARTAVDTRGKSHRRRYTERLLAACAAAAATGWIEHPRRLARDAAEHYGDLTTAKVPEAALASSILALIEGDPPRRSDLAPTSANDGRCPTCESVAAWVLDDDGNARPCPDHRPRLRAV